MPLAADACLAELGAPQPQAVRDHEDAAEGHGASRQHGIQQAKAAAGMRTTL